MDETGKAKRLSLRSPRTFAMKINDDLLVEIFDFCRRDNISPNTYPQNWWYTLAHVCQKWRRVLFATPTRLGITLVCNSRTPVADLLASFPPSLPLVVYWGNPGTFDTEESVEKGALVALGHPERVRRITLRTSENALGKAFSSMRACFPMLETLQLCCSSESVRDPKTTLSDKFEAPNLRHLQLSDLILLRPSLVKTVLTRPSVVSFSIGEITMKSDELMTYLALMPHLKVLKVGIAFSIPSEQTARKERDLCGRGGQPGTAQLALTELEEFEYQGTSHYLEAVAARISAPTLKKLSVTVTNKVDESAELDRNSFKFFARLVGGAANLVFPHCRVRNKDGFSIVMDHEELWTGRGAFELKFNDRGYYFDAKIGLVTNICRVLAPTPSTVQSLLVEDAHRNRWDREPNHGEWRELLRVFDNVKTLRVAGRYVEELRKVLEPKPKDPGSNAVLLSLLPRLQEIVRYGGGEGEKEKEPFAGFVKARKGAGSPVRVVKGPKNRLTLV